MAPGKGAVGRDLALKALPNHLRGQLLFRDRQAPEGRCVLHFPDGGCVICGSRSRGGQGRAGQGRAQPQRGEGGGFRSDRIRVDGSQGSRWGAPVGRIEERGTDRFLLGRGRGGQSLRHEVQGFMPVQVGEGRSGTGKVRRVPHSRSPALQEGRGK